MAEIKKILQVLPDLGLSGPAFAALNLLPELAASGMDVAVVARHGGERSGMFMRAGAVQETVVKHIGTLFDFHSRDIIRKFKPDIIHAFCAEMVPAAVKIAASHHLPLAITVNRLGVEHLLRKARFDKLDENHWGVIALSEAIRAPLIINLRIPADRIAIIPNGLDLRQFAAPNFGGAKATPIISKRSPVVGTYGALVEEKGQRDFIQTAAIVIGKGYDAEFLVMGDGADKQRLREEAEQFKIGNRLTFSMSTITDMRNLPNIDVFVEPTHSEGFGMSVLQAMASGVPVVANGVGGIFDLIKDGEHGLLVRSKKNEEMSEAICRLLSDEHLRVELAQNARARVENEFSTKVLAPKILAYFAKIKDGLGNEIKN